MRCNVGIEPIYLTDQHLIAEYRELLIVFGQLKHQKFILKSEIPKQFSLGKGHINFFKDKLFYIEKRWRILKKEMVNRDFIPTLTFPDYSFLSESFKNDYKPLHEHTMIIKNRIIEKIQMKPSYYRFRGDVIQPDFIDNFKNSIIFHI